MISSFSAEQKSGLLKRGLSRRSFGRLATMITAGAALPFYNERALAQLSMVKSMSPDAVKINANENPLAPCPEAADAMHSVIKKGGRYLYEETFVFRDTLAEICGVKPEYVTSYAGSSDPLHRAVLSFCSPDQPFVKADPGYEAGERAATFIGAKTINVPLKKGTWDHDVKAMVAAHPSPGLIYICNPNNPTGTLTSRADLEWIVANKSKGTTILLDEAYTHISPNAAPCTDLVGQDKDLIVLRTFSKLYGMAGLRAGAAIARPDLLAKMKDWSAGAMPVTDGGRDGEFEGEDARGRAPQDHRRYPRRRVQLPDRESHRVHPLREQQFMMNAKRPGAEFYKAMTQEKVYIGRVWPVWPMWMRVSVGTKDEMAKFKAACLKCYNA